MTKEQLKAAQRQAWRYGQQVGRFYFGPIRVASDENGEYVAVPHEHVAVLTASGEFFATLAGFLPPDSWEMTYVRDAYHDGVDDARLPRPA